MFMDFHEIMSVICYTNLHIFCLSEKVLPVGRGQLSCHYKRWRGDQGRSTIWCKREYNIFSAHPIETYIQINESFSSVLEALSKIPTVEENCSAIYHQTINLLAKLKPVLGVYRREVE